MARYQVKYGDARVSYKAYYLLDSEKGTVLFESDNKTELIAESQRLNGFNPIDGDEQTYGRQIINYEDFLKTKVCVELGLKITQV